VRYRVRSSINRQKRICHVKVKLKVKSKTCVGCMTYSRVDFATKETNVYHHASYSHHTLAQLFNYIPIWQLSVCAERDEVFVTKMTQCEEWYQHQQYK
jgi:hypothetical protein